MQFHEGTLDIAGAKRVDVDPKNKDWWPSRRAYETASAPIIPGLQQHASKPYFYVNGQPRAAGAPFADPCPQEAPLRDYHAAFIQTELTYNKHGWFDPQGRIVILEHDIKDIIDPDTRTRIPEPLFFRANSGECINFKSSNFVPGALNADDFQIYTPTDTIGQHIHLVKFDVTSSDGSGNGFNYEDATFSPDEVRERIFAFNRTRKPGEAKLAPKPHPLFQRGGDIYESAQREPERFGALLKKGQCPEQGALSDEEYEKTLSRDHPFCGAQRTTQRWWADPILNAATSKDDTLRTVFTHDHMGPSSHQQHGLYAGLVIEPGNSVWARLGAKVTKDEIGYAGRHSLNCDRGAGDPRRSPICDKLIGGSNLALKTAPELLESADPHPISGRIEPRAPLELRGDGGPTATFANILAPECIGDSDSNPVQPPDGRNDPVVENCPAERKAHDTRREFMLALADFGIAYNMALEPINPEPRGDSSILRDTERRRFGQRHVALALPHPLGISSEDPGSQYFNYRNEPVALRISEGKAIDALGGWDYRQSNKRADLDPVSAVMHRSNGDITQPMPPARDCKVGAHDCIGDPANAFSTAVHLRRDIELATKPVSAKVSPAIRYYWRKPHNDDGEFWRSEERLDKVLAAVESWRRRFNCMLYKKDLLGEKEGCADNIERLEPWRVFGDPATPIIVGYEGDPVQVRLIQGAQEAQHVFTMNGMKWLRLPGDRDENNSGFVNTQALGISEHFEFDLRLPKTELPHTDYLYFGSSVDQLWDGLWGIMRSYLPAPDQNVFTPMARRFSPSWDKIFDLRNFLEPLPSESKARTAARQNEREELAERKAEKDKHPDLCIDPQDENARIAGRYFDVSAVRVCDLMHDIDGDCANDDTPGKLRKYSAGLRYSERHDIHDERAIIYVLNDEGNCASTKACKDPTRAWRKKTNHDALEAMRAEFKAGRVIEPLVLRAAAGACVHVNLRNLLPAKLDDGPSFDPSGNPRRIDDARAYHNFLPMIADGFNINQFRMGNAVGLSAPRVTQHVAFTDGSNVGLNGPVVAGKEIKESLENEEAFRARKAKVDAMDVSSAAGRKAKDEANKALYKKLFEDLERGLLIDEGDYRHRQGSLASACVGDPSIDGKDESHCHFDYVWSLRDFREDKVRLKGAASAGEDYETIHPPVEYGALPLRSFGDAIKHPAHGLGGALIVGPQGSQVCDHDHNRFARSIMAPDDKSSGGRRKIVVPGGISAEICEANGKRYVDHVLMVQDAVNAQQNGIPLPNLRGAEEPDDYGVKALNYKTEPLWARRGGDVSVAFEERNLDDFSKALSSDCATGIRALEKGHPCDPETPVLSANAGDRVRLNIVHPGGHTRQMSLALSGHAWNPYPWSNSSTTLDPNGAQSHVRQGVYNAFGPMMGVTLLVDAGGSGRTPMDYLFRSQASFLFDGGIWGLLRVQPEASDHPAATAP